MLEEGLKGINGLKIIGPRLMTKAPVYSVNLKGNGQRQDSARPFRHIRHRDKAGPSLCTSCTQNFEYLSGKTLRISRVISILPMTSAVQ